MVEIVKFIEPFAIEPRIKRNSVSSSAKRPPIDEDGIRKRVANVENIQMEQLRAESLQGQDRRNYLQQKLTELGVAPVKRDKKHRPRVPMKMAFEMIKTAEKRAEKMKRERKEAGADLIISSSNQIVCHKQGLKETHVWTSVSHPMKPVFDRKQEKKRKNRVMGRDKNILDRGIRINTGRYNNGILQLSKKEIQNISSN